MTLKASLITLLILGIYFPLQAQIPKLLPESCEKELALRAGPEHLRNEAAVYVLKESGFELVQESRNGFTCIVNRDHPRVLKPTCFDAAGGEAIVPKLLYFGQELMAGRTTEQINTEVAAKFETGEYFSPKRPGIAYMLSNFNRPYNPQSDSLGWFPPHLMFYAPNLVGEDIGFNMESYHENLYQPFVGYQGPHGFMIVRVQEESTPDPKALLSCPSWVKE